MRMSDPALDSSTVDLLAEHKKAAARQCDAVGSTLSEDRYVFSYAADKTRPCSPSGMRLDGGHTVLELVNSVYGPVDTTCSPSRPISSHSPPSCGSPARRRPRHYVARRRELRAARAL